MVAFDKVDHSIHDILFKYYTLAIRSGFTIEDKLENPTVEQNTFFNNTLTSDFQLSEQFIQMKLIKWLSLTPSKAQILAHSIYSVFMDLNKMGKNESSLKNTYVKFMCWFYYRLRSVIAQIDSGKIPKIMYEGNISTYELYLLEVFHRCGCDVVILNNTYQEKIKSDIMFPDVWPVNKGEYQLNGTFIKSLKNEYIAQQKSSQILGPASPLKLNRNAWLNSISLDEVIRRDRPTNNFICTALLQFTGVDDRNTYKNKLYSIYKTMVDDGRMVIVWNNGIPVPTPQELAKINRPQILNDSDLITMVVNNLNSQKNDLTQYVKYVFKDVISEMTCSLRKKVENVVKLLALYLRYCSNIKSNKIGCILAIENTAFSEFDYIFFDFISRIAFDVVIFNPEKITDNPPSYILSTVAENTMRLKEYPVEKLDATYSTTAYNALQDFSSMMYDGSAGVYKDYQYKKAEIVFLKTMYEEIPILWNSEINLRDGFSTNDDSVTIPVLFAKVCGVKEGNKKAYAKDIEKLVRGMDDVLFIHNKFPFEFSSSQNNTNSVDRMLDSFFGFTTPNTQNTAQQVNVASVMTGGHIDKKKLIQHSNFKYSYLKDNVIDHMVDKLDYLLQSNIIEGMGKNGTENVLLQVFFNLPKTVITLIQKFDFTKSNPKIVYLNTTESILTLEQTIFLQYMSFLGFDIVMFVPTGYNIVEKYLHKKLFTEYQIGEYLYNMQIDIRTKKGIF